MSTGLLVSLAAILSSNESFADAARGKELFAQRCASCHGNEGKGDGPIGASLPPDLKPRNLADGSFKFATDDTKMRTLLKSGGAAGGLSPIMPGAPGLTEPEYDSLIEFIHSLHKK